jgi:hypothetical protein
MKTTQSIHISLLTLLFIQLSPAHAITFTGDTYIGVNDTTFDGMDIGVSNCTLTIDGPHSFVSVQLLTGGVITHTFAANGGLPALRYEVTAEAHRLSSHALSLLSFSNVNLATVVVKDSSASVVYTNGIDYQIIPATNGLTGLQLPPGSSITEGSTNLVDYQYSGPSVPSGLTLTVSNNVLIQAGGSINADGRGFGGGQGPGSGKGFGSPPSGGGAGHGGDGGAGASLDGSGLVYGSMQAPTTKGSGGGSGLIGLGGAGGGAVKLVIGGALLVEGRISANGSSSVTNRSGGGSGGSIWVSAQTVAGSGVISANGGNGELPSGGGGAGGRISIQSGINVFTGSTTAVGGNGYSYGGAGTIYTQTEAGHRLLLDNGGHQGLTTLTPVADRVALTAQSGAVFSIPGSPTFGGFMIRSNASLMMSNNVSGLLTVVGDATVEAGGSITADGMGSPANLGRGAGRLSQGVVSAGGGGGYGGTGGSANGLNATGGQGYGSYTGPFDLGSGGANSLGIALGSAGGGVIRLNVTGTLIVNGRISANGVAGVGNGSGGGSGGSISITAQRLAGAGRISANGGEGNGFGLYAGGGGGGGRIAAQAASYFLGTISAQGGNGYTRGGAGTIYFSGQQTPGQLVIDNGGSPGTNTVVSTLTSSMTDVRVSGGAVAAFSSQLALHNLLIASNSRLVVSNIFLSASGDVVIQVGGRLMADGNGYGASQGPGAGRYSSVSTSGTVGGGGGYGGFGGAGAGTTSALAPGGAAYGTAAGPLDRGSGGGAPLTSAAGSAGGGAIRVTALGALKVDGVISADGNAGLVGGGGGSGGGVQLSAGSISGNGTITANGGEGSGNGGGGGGGRVAIEYGTNLFSGNIAAHGGDGINRGGAGTVYTKSRGSSFAELVIDNGGHPGTNTSWLPSGTVNLTITGGAVVTPTGSLVLNSLVIGPDSALVFSNKMQLTIRGDLLIQHGGAIMADGAGYGPGLGSGGGRFSDSPQGVFAGGGGYGGNGACGATTAMTGGATYGSLTAPLDWGSGGGGVRTVPGRSGAAGGGAIQISVNGTLTVLGRVSANGSDAVQGGGGGSGGSINISTHGLVGSGLISANGGLGGPQSGGGGGGRIAIAVDQPNTFGGTITAFGGGGYAWGGAGTIYVRPLSVSEAKPMVVVDNGGQLGTNTSWLSTSVFDLTVRGGGIAAPPPQQLINNLLIETNGWLRLTNQTLTVMGNAKIEAGGGISADGTGFGNGQGPGTGRFSTAQGYGYLGGGGGYGGCGGSASTPAVVAAGGLTYGSLTAPIDRGSSGAASTSTYGGAGGGAVRLIITGTLQLEGMLSAQGWPGAIPGSGGGSGGSIWVTAGALTGSGWIAVNGGGGNGNGGGGGGGRIALEYAANGFTGPITAFGGSGSSSGGAGTIYLKPKSQPVGQVIVDNGGQLGGHTTLGPLSAPYDLAIRNGALADATNSSLSLSNLNIGWGGSLSVSRSTTEMSLSVLRDAVIESGGSINLDGKGYFGMRGPGSGTTTNSIGSGGGYGGHGGASALQPGGIAYGSALQPVDPGSSGGFGSGTWTNGSEGGGALRLSVGRALTVNGSISANGNPGLQDDAGGGSGGSLWISAGVLAGTGEVLAIGGDGELFQGGGGGGGRIAVYSSQNLFSGLVSAAGGDGFAPGQDGTIQYGSISPTLAVVGQTPNNVVSYAVSNVDLVFNSEIDPYTAPDGSVTLMTPNGSLPSGQVLVALINSTALRVSFPPQTAEGEYHLMVGSQLQGLYGQPFPQKEAGGFAISWPVIQGVVTDAQSEPVAGVLLKSDAGLASTQTDSTGAYSLKVVPGGTVTVVPSCTNLVFVPGAKSYVSITGPVMGQNYLAVTSIAPTASVRSNRNGSVLSWPTIPGVTYQALSSTNLTDWVPYGPPNLGSNGVLEVTLPRGDTPQMFFQIRANN